MVSKTLQIIYSNHLYALTFVCPGHQFTDGAVTARDNAKIKKTKSKQKKTGMTYIPPCGLAFSHENITATQGQIYLYVPILGRVKHNCK